MHVPLVYFSVFNIYCFTCRLIFESHLLLRNWLEIITSCLVVVFGRYWMAIDITEHSLPYVCH